MLKKFGDGNMIIILKANPDPAQLEALIAWLKAKNLEIHASEGESHKILGLVGDTSAMDVDLISA